MWRLTYNPTAGYILNVAGDQAPGPISPQERTHLRELARQVAQIAAQPRQQATRELWYRHSALQRPRPMLLVFLEDSWLEVLPIASTVTVKDPFWGQWEWYLKHLIYRAQRLGDDFVIEPDLHVTLAVRTGDWGIEPAEYQVTDNARGSFHWTPPMREESSIAKLHPATIEADLTTTNQAVAALRDCLGDILPVHIAAPAPSACLIDIASHLRGIEQVMLDMYDRPAWLHELMAFLSNETLRRWRYFEEQGLATLNNGAHYTGSGTVGYSRELPAEGFDGTHVRLRDLWGACAAQAASEVGPDQHEEFILRHELPLLELTGLNCYGCCEPYTRKFDMLKRNVPRLRRVSVSPWCDVQAAAEALQARYIFSWKPNPAMLVGRFDEDRLRACIRRTLDVARGCCLEIVLKDTITLDNDPRRVESFIRIARDEIERVQE